MLVLKTNKLFHKAICTSVLIFLVFSFSSSAFAGVDKSLKKEIKKLELVAKTQPNDVENLIQLAERYSWAEKPKKAISTYERVVFLEPNNIEALKKLKDFYSWEGMDDKLIAVYEKLVELDPKNINLRRELAQRYGWSDNTEAAIREYEKVVKMDPKDVESRKSLADFYSWTDRPKEAIVIYKAILKINPKDKDAIKKIKEINSWYKEEVQVKEIVPSLEEEKPVVIEETKEVVEEIVPSLEEEKPVVIEETKEETVKEVVKGKERDISGPSETIDQMLEKAQQYVWQDNLEAAIAVCEGILAVDPDNLETLKRLKDYYGWTGKSDKIIGILEQIVKLEPDNIVLRRELADQYGWKNKPIKSMNMFEEILKLDPKNTEVRKKLSDFYMWNGRGKEAIPLYEQMVQESPNDMKLKKILSDLYMGNGMVDEGLSELEKMHKMNPDDMDLMKNLANQYMWNSRASDAMLLLQEIIEKNPEDIEARKSLAELYSWNARGEQAIKEYFQILNNIQTQERDGIYKKIADNYYWTGSYGQARKFYQEVLRINPTNVEARNRLDEVERFYRPEFFIQSDILRGKGRHYVFVETAGLSHMLNNGIRLLGRYSLSSVHDADEVDHAKSAQTIALEASKYLGRGFTVFGGMGYSLFRSGKGRFNGFVRFIQSFSNLSIGGGYGWGSLELQDVDQHTFDMTAYYNINRRMAISSSVAWIYYSEGTAPSDNHGFRYSVSPIVHILFNPILDLSYTFYGVHTVNKNIDNDNFFEYGYPKSDTHTISLYFRKDFTNRFFMAISEAVSIAPRDNLAWNTLFTEFYYKLNEFNYVDLIYIWSKQLKTRSGSPGNDHQVSVKYAHMF